MFEPDALGAPPPPPPPPFAASAGVAISAAIAATKAK
jgi:hypothetical protein